MSIMKTYIYPHMHRIRKLRIDVRFSSSLPSFPHDIHGVTTNLVYLELSCREDDGGRTLPTNNRELVSSTQHQYPALSTLFIDGRNYYNACKNPAEWADMVANVNDLAISRYRPRAGESFWLRDFILPLRTMVRLDHLKITDLALCTSASRFEPPLVSPPWLNVLSYFGLSDFADFELIAELFDFLSVAWEVAVFRCALGDLVDFVENMYLKLNGIDANQDLTSFLYAWEGNMLDIVDCLGFTDDVLDKMGAQENGVFMCARLMNNLDIVNCPNFSVAALKRLVAARLTAPFHPDHGPRMEYVHVSGHVPDLSPEDRLWFNENVPEFEYT